MTFTVPNELDAFNANQAELDKVDLDVLVAAYGGDGVMSGCDVTAQASPDMTVAVAAGTIRRGDETKDITGGNVTISAADATNPRFDLIAVDMSGAKSATAGTPAAEPVFPAIPANNIVLAAVYVPAGDTAIQSGQIIDKRVLIKSDALLLDSRAADPPGATDLIQLYNKSGVLTEQLFQGGLAVQIPLGASEGFIAYLHHLGFLVVDSGATPFLSDAGLLRGYTTTGTIAQASAAAGLSINLLSGATSGNDAGIEQNNLVLRRDMQYWLMTKYRLPDVTSVRMFIGMTDQTLATMVGADNPAGNYVGMSFSTPRGDTTWKWIRKNGTTQTVTNTSLAVDALVHFLRFRIFTVPSIIVSQLFDSAYVAQHTTGMATSLPAGTVALRFVAGVETQTAAGRSLDYFYSYLIGQN